MKSLTVRGVDEDVYGALQRLARANHRSLQEQIRMILEREVLLIKGGHLSRTKSIRRRLADRPWGDIAAEIRSERSR